VYALGLRAAVANPPTGAEAKGVHWLEPTLLAEVAYAQMTRDGIVRQAVFHGLREDKPAREITRDRPSRAKAVEKPSVEKKAGRKSGKQAKPAPNQEALKITHPDRVIDPASGTTKLQLAEFYTAIAARIQPHLRERPVALVRAPEGITGELFFQKRAEKLKIPAITRLDEAYKGQPVMIIDNPEALIGAVQMNVIELHTWNATSANLDRPDRFVLDLDPDPALPWERMIEATQLTLTVLDELGLQSFLKTSGGKGIHIVVPLVPQDDWDSVKTFSRALVQHMAKLLPDRFTAVSGPKNRIGRIFIDYLRNNHGATTICAYAVRARSGLAVSVPIYRDEVETLEGADVWTIHNLEERLAELEGDDPWGEYASVRQTITADMRQRLGLK
jgi:bifunctional non-homologous end joining protein LigD